LDLNVNHFTAALSKPLPQPAPPADFNINVSQFKPSRAAAIIRAIHEGQLVAFILNGQYWVSRGDLQDLLPPGHDTYDPADVCCFIPANQEEWDTLITASATTAGLIPADTDMGHDHSEDGKSQPQLGSTPTP
jgi:hypothetical protein